MEPEHMKEDKLGYVFTTRTYYPKPICSEPDYCLSVIPSYSSLPSQSRAELEWDENADLRDIINSMPMIEQNGSIVSSAYGAINMSVGLPVLPDMKEMVQFVPDSGATNHMVSNADYLTQSLYRVTGNPSVQGIDGNSLEVVATGSILIRDYLGRELN
jgi:hypothetical protein